MARPESVHIFMGTARKTTVFEWEGSNAFERYAAKGNCVAYLLPSQLDDDERDVFDCVLVSPPFGNQTTAYRRPQEIV